MLVHADAGNQSNIPVVAQHPLMRRAAPTTPVAEVNDMALYRLTMSIPCLPWGHSIAPPRGPTMPKLAISDPKKAKKEIDRWRKRIKFSQVFMRGLKNEIREFQMAIDADDSQLTTVAQHYRRRLAGDRDALVSLAHAEGVCLM